jgi:hypothetical protein
MGRSFSNLINNILCEEVDINDITHSINSHNEVIINYNGDDNTHTGKRIIQVYAYGLTKAGNPCIRAFEPYGDTKTKVPHWKLFRIDRINKWQTTNRKFLEPPKEQGWDQNEFNKNGDKSMSVVYQVAKFDNNISDLDRLRNRTNNIKNNFDNIDVFRSKNGTFTKTYNNINKNIKKGISDTEESDKLSDKYWKGSEMENDTNSDENDNISGPIGKDKFGNNVIGNDDKYEDEESDEDEWLTTKHNNFENRDLLNKFIKFGKLLNEYKI